MGWYLLEIVDTQSYTAVTIPGGSGKERLAESCRAKLAAGTARGSLAKGSWHGAAVTEGASGVKSDYLRMGWCLPVVIVTQL